MIISYCDELRLPFRERDVQGFAIGIRKPLKRLERNFSCLGSGGSPFQNKCCDLVS